MMKRNMMTTAGGLLAALLIGGALTMAGQGVKLPNLKIAENLKKASNKAMAPDDKIALLKETKELEADAIGNLAKLAEALRAQDTR